MARKMRKFSEGGALGKYNRRMADIEKDYKIALAKGKNEGVAKAKYEQRKADAEDDRAKRTGADRTATRAAERASEVTLKEARNTKGASITKRDMANDFKKYFADKPMTAKAAEPAAEKAKPQTFGAAFKEARARLGAGKTFTYNGKSFTTNIGGEGRKSSTSSTNIGAGASSSSTNNNAAAAARDAKAKQDAAAAAKDAKAKQDAAAAAAAAAKDAKAKRDAAATATTVTGPSTKRGLNPNSIAGMLASGKLFGTSDAFRKSQEAKYGKAKGGKIMKKFAKGGSIPPQPSAADRARSKKRLDELKKLKPTDAEGKVAASANRSEGRGYAKGGVTKEMPSSKAMGSLNMAKGGKAMAPPPPKTSKTKPTSDELERRYDKQREKDLLIMPEKPTGYKKGGKAKGNPFAATKFGAAMMKKGADAKGRAMPKFAKGGSIDGCAVRGKTKAKRVTMKKGGSC